MPDLFLKKATNVQYRAFTKWVLSAVRRRRTQSDRARVTTVSVQPALVSTHNRAIRCEQTKTRVAVFVLQSNPQKARWHWWQKERIQVSPHDPAMG